MVSTRGIKPKYDIGERVLCYEPDPKKMKMLYDAKVMGHRPSEKMEGKRGGFVYFVHFLGWNTTWDRFVADDMLMKDDQDGRKEQDILYQLLENAKRNEKNERKKKRKSTDRIRASTDSNPSPVPSETSPETKVSFYKNNKRLCEDTVNIKEAENENKPKRVRLSERTKVEETKEVKIKLEHQSTPELTSSLKEDDGGIKLTISFEKNEDDKLSVSSATPYAIPGAAPGATPGPTSGATPDPCPNQEEDICTEPLPLQYPDSLRKGLERDLKIVSGTGRLVQLPAQPNIVTLLEGFVRKFAISRLAAAEKQIQKNANAYRQDKEDSEYFDDVRVSVNVCKEVAEGFRILVDFLLGSVLLYPQERDQFSKAANIRPHMESIERMMADVSHLRAINNKGKKEASLEEKPSSKRRMSRKKDSETEPSGLPGSGGSMSSGAETPTPSTVSSTTAFGGQYPQYKQSHQILRELETWKLLPESVYFEEPAPLSLIYGGVHLARFAVNLPHMFVKMRFPNKKVKMLTRFVEFLVDYVASLSDEIFTDSVYIQSNAKK